MSVGKRDPHTGQMTTGHDWNGIEELNTPVPPVVYIFLGLAFSFSVVYWILMPAWPLGVTYTKGLLGIGQHSIVDADLRDAAIGRAEWTTKIAAMDTGNIQADENLMRILRETGAPLFGDNCAACHGSNAQGAPGFPSLVDKAWLWGGDADAVMETIRVGINAGHDETRFSQMMAFGRDGMLDRAALLNVVSYVRSLSNPALADGSGAQAVTAGREVFTTNCASCHGEDGTGNIELGAPDLTDDFWIYGGDRQSIFDTVYGGRAGHMPNWDGRLSDVDRKILALYILDLGASEQ
ncbi:MAG: cytochrome-c oxidase, cbb3-type subunit III [Alphaproteobacteria bacterium HGW-Alphaproteobacteria-5]|nr:MAG: cytochrome-c oxidase, cbb3-type subunit III [Alphaproteobacteria bacterium HGW-Alphaproteobacteria-5]